MGKAAQQAPLAHAVGSQRSRRSWPTSLPRADEPMPPPPRPELQPRAAAKKPRQVELLEQCYLRPLNAKELEKLAASSTFHGRESHISLQ